MDESRIKQTIEGTIGAILILLGVIYLSVGSRAVYSKEDIELYIRERPIFPLFKLVFKFSVNHSFIACFIGILFIVFGTWWLRPKVFKSHKILVMVIVLVGSVIFGILVPIEGEKGPDSDNGPSKVSTSTPFPIPTSLPEEDDRIILQKSLKLYKIEDGKYSQAKYLKRFNYLTSYFRDYQIEHFIEIQQPFFMQAGEVTVGEYKKFVQNTGRPVEDRWAKDKEGEPYPDNRPIEGISREEAENYAKWLSKKTGWTLRLPSLEQWAAACIKYGEDRPIIRTRNNQPISRLRNNVDHLLGNLREWSFDSCKYGQGYWVHGENYMTNVDFEIEGKCVPNNVKEWAGVGFRLVKIEK